MVDTVQPHGLIRLKLIGVVATNEMQLLRWNTPGARHHTSVFYGERRWRSRTKPASRRREKNVLDIPLYRPGDYPQVPAQGQMSEIEIFQTYLQSSSSAEAFFRKSFSAIPKAPEMIRKSAIPRGIV